MCADHEGWILLSFCFRNREAPLSRFCSPCSRKVLTLSPKPERSERGHAITRGTPFTPLGYPFPESPIPLSQGLCLKLSGPYYSDLRYISYLKGVLRSLGSLPRLERHFLPVCLGIWQPAELKCSSGLFGHEPVDRTALGDGKPPHLLNPWATRAVEEVVGGTLSRSLVRV